MAAVKAVCTSLPRALWQNSSRLFSAFSQSAVIPKLRTTGISQALYPTSLLSPACVNVLLSAGMKQKGKLQKRCRHCFFIMIDERLHVWCDVHPRHKQMQMIPKPKTVIITTHATQGKIRPW